MFHVEDNGPALTVIEKRWHKDVLYTWYKEEWQADFTIGIKSTNFPDPVHSGEHNVFLLETKAVKSMLKTSSINHT